MCEHHDENGEALRISARGFAEAVRSCRSIKRSVAREKENAVAAAASFEREVAEKRPAKRRMSLRRSDSAGEDAVQLEAAKVLDRHARLTFEKGGVVDSLLEVLKAERERSEELRQQLILARVDAGLAEVALAESRRKEERGAIRSFIYSNERRFECLQEIVGVSASFIEDILAPIVARRTRFADPCTAVMWFLYYWRTSASTLSIACKAQVNRISVMEKLDRVGAVLCDELHDYVRFPTIDEWAATITPELAADFPGVLAMSIDATALPIYSPTDPSEKRLTYNHKAGRASLRWFLLVLPDGEIVWRSPVVEGSANDATLYQNSTFTSRALEFYQLTTPWTLAIFGDKGYRSVIAPSNFVFYVTESAAEDADVDDSDSLQKPIPSSTIRTTKICPHRFVVERSFGQLKQKWSRLTSGKLHHYQLENIDNAVGALCAIQNLSMWPHKYASLRN